MSCVLAGIQEALVQHSIGSEQISAAVHDRTNHIWSVSNLPRVFIVSWLIMPTIFEVSVIYNIFLSCHG